MSLAIFTLSPKFQAQKNRHSAVLFKLVRPERFELPTP